MSTEVHILSQDASTTQPQAIPAYKAGKSNKAPAVQAAIAAKRANGDSISKIATDLKVSRSTVYKVIESTNLDRMIQDGTLTCGLLIPKATQAIEKSLDRGDGSLGIRLLEGLGVLGEGRIGAQKPVQIELSQAIGIMFKQGTDTTQVSGPQPAKQEPIEATLTCSTPADK